MCILYMYNIIEANKAKIRIARYIGTYLWVWPTLSVSLESENSCTLVTGFGNVCWDI